MAPRKLISGPADTEAKGRIENRANELLAAGLDGVRGLFAQTQATMVGELGHW